MRMNRSMLIVIAVTCAGLGLAAGQPPVTGAQAELRVAIDTANVDGDLTRAIRQLQAVVDRYGRSDRAVAATALMHLAECYQKLGDVQARAAYARIVREFGDQPTIAANARSRLAALEGAAPAAAAPTLALRRIYDGYTGLDWCNGLSSDGRYLSHPDWKTGDIALVDLTTSAVRRVTTAGTINEQNGEFGECSVFSPDNRQLAFYWGKRRGASAMEELRLSSVDGGKPRTLYRSEHYLQPLDWSADGRRILISIHQPGRRQLATVSVADGAMRVLETVEGPLRAVFSPDGRFVAYSARQSPESTKSDLFVIGAAGGQKISVIRHPADDYVVGWSPDGRTVFFASDRTGSNSIWGVAADNGRPMGSPVLVKSNIGPLTPVRLLEGRFYFQARSDLSEVYVAPIDLDRGALSSRETPVAPYPTTANFAPDWSPDGRFLAFRSMPGAGDPWSGPTAEITIVNVETRETRVLRPDIPSFDPNDGPKWAPDGRSLLVIGMQATPHAGIHKVDVQTGQTTPLVNPPSGTILHAIWAPGGASIFYPVASPTRVMRRDLSTRADTLLVDLDGPGGAVRLAASPDGRSVAYTARAPGGGRPMTLNLVAADGGAPREIFRTAADEGIGGLAWSPDGRSVYFQRRLAASANPARPREVWRVTPEGQAEATSIEQLGRWFAFSPDGRRVAFSKGESKAELWVLENLSSAVIKGS